MSVFKCGVRTTGIGADAPASTRRRASAGDSSGWQAVGVSRVAITRLPERASADRRVLDALLDEVLVGHVALVRDAEPMIVPTAVARDGDESLIHGSTGSS